MFMLRTFQKWKIMGKVILIKWIHLWWTWFLHLHRWWESGSKGSGLSAGWTHSCCCALRHHGPVCVCSR